MSSVAESYRGGGSDTGSRRSHIAGAMRGSLYAFVGMYVWVCMCVRVPHIDRCMCVCVCKNVTSDKGAIQSRAAAIPGNLYMCVFMCFCVAQTCACIYGVYVPFGEGSRCSYVAYICAAIDAYVYTFVFIS
jgi:hypothetical protein